MNYINKGIEFMCGSRQYLVDSFNGDENGNVESVNLVNGTSVKCKIVIVGIGASPNIDLFKDILDIDQETKGLKVNKYLQSVTNEDIYGCGDIISYHCSYLNRMTRLEHVKHARKSAIFAVKSMTNNLNFQERKIGYRFLPTFYSRFLGKNGYFMMIISD